MGGREARASASTELEAGAERGTQRVHPRGPTFAADVR